MLANGLALAGIAVVFTIGFVAHFVSQTNWAWATAAAGATGVGYGALITSVRGPIHLRFAATVAGLTVQQRGQALTALRRGDVPSDPRVVAAASRLGALAPAMAAAAAAASAGLAKRSTALSKIFGLFRGAG